MADQRRAETTKIGSADYAKVAERLRLFREDHANSKTESSYEYEVDQTVVFTVWLWKDKDALIDLMKSGVTDKELLRQSADANGTAKGAVGTKEKDFEKLESIALGRALAMLGYLASGEIASSEEMEEFEKYRSEQAQKAVEELVGQIQVVENNLELNKLVQANAKLFKNPDVVEAAKKKQSEFAKKAAPAKEASSAPSPASDVSAESPAAPALAKSENIKENPDGTISKIDPKKPASFTTKPIKMPEGTEKKVISKTTDSGEQGSLV